MPRNYEEKDDIPDRKDYEVVEPGCYTGYIWDKRDPVTRPKRSGKGDFRMWPLVFRLTHNAKGEALKKPVIIYTNFFKGQMMTIKNAVGFPMIGKPVVVQVVTEEYEKAGELERDASGNIKMDWETNKAIRKMTQERSSRIDRGEKGQGHPEVDSDKNRKALTVDEMDALDLEEGRTKDAPGASTSDDEDLPF